MNEPNSSIPIAPTHAPKLVKIPKELKTPSHGLTKQLAFVYDKAVLSSQSLILNFFQ